MRYRADILHTRPLTVHFSLHNPSGTRHAVLAPRVLAPLGAFVTLVVRDSGGTSVYQTPAVKFGLKLHPDRPESYLELEPGYSYGIVFTLEDLDLGRGPHELLLAYSNEPYTGPASRPIGELTFEASLPFVVPPV